jgi:alpha-tubulin suppressor-like RCC1 family protein
VANQGQVKNMAVTAVNEFNAALPGGAGSTLNGLAVSLTATSGSTSDYAAVNLGQLKAIAKPFYDQLFRVDYYGPPAISGTTMTSGTYPWIAWGLTANDYSAANIGQVKNLFSFDLTYTSGTNSLPNWWREYYFGTLSVSATSTVSYNGGTITYLQAFQNDISPYPGPTFSPPGEILRSATTVTLSITGTGSIYYTTNGSDPAASGSLYSTGIPVSGFETIRAIGYSGTIPTQESTAMYWVLSGSSPAPVAAGLYHSLAIKADGSLWTWGYNGGGDYDSGGGGQLGTGSYVDQWYPTEVSMPHPVIAVAGGWYHSLAVTNDGQVWAWGSNLDGQIGVTPSVSSTASPTAVSTATNAIAVAAGYNHSVALTSTGSVLTWGNNSYGELGNNTTTGTSSPIQVSGLSGVKAIAAGQYFTAALTGGSSVWVWGYNGYDVCGPSTNHLIPSQITSVSGVTAIAAGDDHILALKSDGTVWAWGDNQGGQLGGGSVVPFSTGTAVEVLTTSGSLTNVVAIAAGVQCSLAVRGDGTVWGWGNNQNWQLGSSSTGSNVAVQITGSCEAIGVAASYHSLIVTGSGTIISSGLDENGQLGLGYTGVLDTVDEENPPAIADFTFLPQPQAPAFSPDTGFYSSPQSVVVTCTDSQAAIYYTMDGSNPSPNNGTIIPSGEAIDIASPTMLRACAIVGGISSPVKSAAYHFGYQMLGGGTHSILLDTNGTVYTCGSNLNGQLGLPWAVDDEFLPNPVTGLSGSATAIAAGENNSAAVVNSATDSGTVWVWGDNREEQCAVSATENTCFAPVQVPGLNGAVAVACGREHTVALMSSGTVYCWGYNEDGELGNGSNFFSTDTPVAVSGLPNVKAIAAGWYFTLALTDSGSVYSWGSGDNGALGNGTFTSSNVPVQVNGLSNIVAISAAGYEAFALRNDGTVWAWGESDGDLLAGGDNTGDGAYATPVLVGTLRDVAVIGAGANHSVALEGDGSVWAWGDNLYYEVTNTGIDPSYPDAISGLALTGSAASTPSIPTMVSAGDDHSLVVVNTDGVQTLWAWGDNAYGELGDGEQDSRYTPEMVKFSEYPANLGMPDYLALELGLNPEGSGFNNEGIPYWIAYEDGDGLNPTLPYTPYQLPSGSGTAPTIYVSIPAGATLH